MSSRLANGFFVTGTDTGVGKTLVAGALLAALRERGVNAVPMKPVQTGAMMRGGRLLSPDLEFCLRVGGLQPAPDPKCHMAPYLFKDACSPHLAAERTRNAITLRKLTSSYRTLAKTFEAVIVEGAGGVLAPIGKRFFMVDIIKAMKLPTVLVARPGLGTLNHTLLSMDTLRQRGIPVAAVVLSGCAAHPDYIERNNAKTLRRLAGRIPVVQFPYLRTEDLVPDEFRVIAQHVFAKFLQTAGCSKFRR